MEVKEVAETGLLMARDGYDTDTDTEHNRACKEAHRDTARHAQPGHPANAK